MDIQNRNGSLVGKPRVIVTSSLGKLSLTQRKLIEKLEDCNYVIIDRKQENIKVTMKDLSAMTAYARIEYSLFSRRDKVVLFKGTQMSICISQEIFAMLLNGKYRWIGHTHPGSSYNCLLPSDADYHVLRMFDQKRSVIYNSIGQYYVFGEE